VSGFSQLTSPGQLGTAGIRYPLLSVAEPHIRGDVARADYGVTGEGVVIGVVDTGVSVAHPALRHADGRTRIRWLLRYGQQPRGVHPELEAEYGCLAEDPCAVYDDADLNQLLSENDVTQLPQDPIGHGTHVTSVAAGRDDAYPGVAPDAQLIFVAAADETGGVYDSRILMGCRFIFEQAARLESPAVINLSLGSDFGSHRGDSGLELALSELAQGPGRAIVVAAGNSGARYTGIFPEQFSPFGNHAEFAVTPDTELHIPVLQYSTRKRDISGTIYVWLGVTPGESIDVSFRAGRDFSEWIAAGEVGATSSDEWGDPDQFDLVILNASGQESYLDLAPGNAVVSIAGRFASDRQFDLAVRGQATVVMWAIGTGQAAYGASSLGPLLPRAQVRGTIQVPATARDLIAVGATVNRTTWLDYTGNTVTQPGKPTGLSLFSSQGPTPLGDLKPELVAPGEGIIAAMAQESDPRGDPRSISQFDNAGSCPGDLECYVIDDLHGIASGTSMAAPLAAGTIALLMQRDRALTQQQAKAYLVAGTQTLASELGNSGAGNGELD
ncbi:MAG TPA: S8 family serine peptidase, partial [Polyangiaceae bacterium]|nr:S8 family serine peptidase [Polyangiaceae bacterium]